MTGYERVFGVGPLGILLSLIMLAVAWGLEEVVGLPVITGSDVVRWVALSLGVLGAVALAGWSIRSLPPAERGQKLVTSGVYRYLRHPIYATLLSCFNFGLAVWLNNWIYIVWAVSLHPLWHGVIRSEEVQMRKAFPGAYDAYCRTTGRFLPRVRRRKLSE